MLRVSTVSTSPQGSPYFTQHFFDGDGALLAADAHSAVSEFWADAAGVIAGQTVMVVQGEVDVIAPATGVITGQHFVPPVTVPGVGSFAELPYATQLLIRWRTGEFKNGREVRGRTFLPTPPVPVSADGIVSAAALATLQSAGNDLVANGTFGVWSRPNAETGAPGSFHVVSAAQPWTQFAVLRSRRD